jgi:hypothetical protein
VEWVQLAQDLGPTVGCYEYSSVSASRRMAGCHLYQLLRKKFDSFS